MCFWDWDLFVGYTAAYNGCFVDNVYSRTLPIRIISSLDVTNRLCIRRCATFGYSFAGTEVKYDSDDTHNMYDLNAFLVSPDLTLQLYVFTSLRFFNRSYFPYNGQNGTCSTKRKVYLSYNL